MIEVKVRVSSAGLVADPATSLDLDVRRVGMPGPLLDHSRRRLRRGSPWSGGDGWTLHRPSDRLSRAGRRHRRSMLRNVSTTDRRHWARRRLWRRRAAPALRLPALRLPTLWLPALRLPALRVK
jgi:uncharacterized membrane protein